MGRRRSRSRTSAKRRKARRSLRIKIVVVVTALCSLGGGGWALAHSRVFGVSRIDVAGPPAPLRADVIRASGIQIGESALSVDLRRVAERVRALPWVATARAEHAGPLAIRIVVTVRRAAAEVHSPNGVWFVDRDGRRVDTSAGPDPLPVIVLPADRVLADEGSSVAAAVSSALELWQRLPEEMRAEMRSITPQLGGELHFVIERIEVNFGSVDDIDAKLRAIALVRAQVALEGKHIRWIDVSSPEHPAARMA